MSEDNNNRDQDSLQHSEDQDPTQIQPSSPTNDEMLDRDNLDSATRRYLATLEEQLRIQNSQIRDANNQIKELSTRQDVEPEPDPDVTRKVFYDDPVRTTKSIVAQELERQIQPIHDFISGFRTNSELDTKITQAASSDQFAHVWNPDVEMYVREVFKNPAIKLDDGNFNAAVVQAIGMQAVTGIRTKPKGDSIVTGQNNAGVTPPRIRPTSPTPRSPVDAERPTHRALTETERKLARMNGMSEEEYLKWIDMPSNEVAFSTLGLKKKES